MLLDQINNPDDLKKLSIADLPLLCDELRQTLISTICEIGGHFASSLGVVELTVALHYIFNTPHDKIVWDVGHQSYIHKILTERKHLLSKIRQLNGPAGFPNMGESVYDAFTAGHAGNSISAALGILEADYHKNEQNNKKNVIAVIGDGSMTSGMAFEALNHAGHLKRRLIVVLNDNEMAISPNVGAISLAFSKALTGKRSTFAQKYIRNLAERKILPEFIYKILAKVKSSTQSFLSTPAMLYKAFGFSYIGPINGHDINALIDALYRARNQDAPVLIHAITKKGKGYVPAESDPIAFHAISPNPTETVASDKGGKVNNVIHIPVNHAVSYTEVFGKTLVRLCKENPNVVGITAAMPDGTGLNYLQKEMPERFFDVGICEQHAVTFAAGLASEGVKPFCAIYSSFLQRSYDQIIHDVCIASLPVVFAIDRAGLVGADGQTHHGAFDISYLRHIPNLITMSPKDEAELKDMLYTASLYKDGPIAVRYPRGVGVGVNQDAGFKLLEIGKGEVLEVEDSVVKTENNSKILLIGIGNTVYTAMEAAKDLSKEPDVVATVFNARFIKPLDKESLTDLIAGSDIIVTIEDNVLMGGFGSAVFEFMSENGLHYNKKIIRCGIEDKFIKHGTTQEQHNLCEIDKGSVIAKIKEILSASSLQQKCA